MDPTVKLNLDQDANLDEDLNQFLREYFFQAKHNFFALYQDDALINQTRNLISEFYNLDPNSILITKDANTAITSIINAFNSPNKLTVSHWPSYSLFFHHLERSLPQKNLRVIILKFKNNQFIPAENIIEVIKQYKTQKVQFVYITFPNSYCGYKPSLSEVLQICESATEGFVIIDEVYYDYLQESCCSLLSSCKNLIVVRSFSKTHGLSGLRVGCIIAQPELIHKLKKWRQFENPTRMALEALSHILKYGKEVFQKSIENNKHGLRLLTKFFMDSNCSIVTTPTSFILIKRDRKNQKLQHFLNQVYVKDLSHWTTYDNDLRKYYRVSTAPVEILKPLLSSI